MRKLFTLIAASAMVLGANAQGYEGNKFFDNWSFGVEGGVTTATTAPPTAAIALPIALITIHCLSLLNDKLK